MVSPHKNDFERAVRAATFATLNAGGSATGAGAISGGGWSARRGGGGSGGSGGSGGGSGWNGPAGFGPIRRAASGGGGYYTYGGSGGSGGLLGTWPAASAPGGLLTSAGFLRFVARGAVGVLCVLGLLTILSDESPGSGRGRSALGGLGRWGGGGGGFGGAGAPTVRLNIPESDVRPGTAIVAACMNRHETLAKVLPEWAAVEGVDEIVLVDFSSDPPLKDTVDATGVPNVKLLRVEGEPKWVLSRAYNLGVNASSMESVLRIDCDYSVRPDFVSAHPLPAALQDSAAATQKTEAEKPGYYRGNYAKARNEDEVHLNGAVFIRRADFWAVGGYDERIQTYGWDDEDLYNRLEKAGLRTLDLDYDKISHTPHGDGARAQSGVRFVGVEIDFNALLLEKLPVWVGPKGTVEGGAAVTHRSTYVPTVPGPPSAAALAAVAATSGSKSGVIDTASSATRAKAAAPSGGNYLVIKAESVPKDLRALTATADADAAWDLSLGRRLHDQFDIPWDLLSSAAAPMKETFLTQLMTREAEMVKAATAAAGDVPRPLSAAVPKPRILLCHVMHGLGNRLRALGSCLSFASTTGRVPLIVWEKDAHIQASYGDLFATKLAVLDSFSPKWPDMKGGHEWDAAWKQYNFHNYMEMEGGGAVKGEQVLDEEDKSIYFKGAYIIEADPALTSWELDNEQLRALTPVPAVADMVAARAAEGLSGMIGVHIRNKTLDKDIDGVSFDDEYGVEAAATMEKWRLASGYPSFITEMRSLMAKDPALKFYVATDTAAVIDIMATTFPGKVVSTPRECDGRDGACVRLALVDILCLSKTKGLLGSNWSSFTEAAQRIGGVEARLAGEHFAKVTP